MINGYRLLLLILPLVFSGNVQAQWQWQYRGLSTGSFYNDASSQALPPSYRPIPDQVDEHDLVLSYDGKGMRLQSSLYTSAPVAGSSTSQSVLNEAYYDFSAAGLDWSVGKKVMPWGVGYGLRPLDIVQQEQRLVDQARELVGVALIAMDAYTETTTKSLVLFQHQTALGREQALAFKYYRSLAGKDLYGVVRLTELGHNAAGLGISAVIGDELEWHASALYLSHYEKFLRAADAPLLASSDPFTQQSFHDGVQMLLGGTWTLPGGWSLLGELWRDDTAYTPQQWSQLQDLIAQQRSLLATAPADAVYNNLLWDMRAYQVPSLMQSNAMLRLSFDGERLDPSLIVLGSPQDGGVIGIVQLDYESGSSCHLFASLRAMGGARDSVYANSPLARVWNLGLRCNGLF